MRTAVVGYLAFLSLTMMVGSASAQVQPRAPAPRPAQLQRPAPAPAQQSHSPAQNEAPQRTTATYDDWIVECQAQTGPPPEKVCDMSQFSHAQQQGQSVPFSRVAIVRPTKGQPVKLVVQVPVNVAFKPEVRIQMSDSDRGWSAPFARCVPAGCFADFAFNEDALSKLRAATGTGKVSFAAADGRDITVPLSFKGFSQAFEALAKE